MVTLDDLNCVLVLADDAVEYLRVDFNMLMPTFLQDKVIGYWTNEENQTFYKKTYVLYKDTILFEESMQGHFTRLHTNGILPEAS